MTKCYQMYSFISTRSRLTDGCIDFSSLQSALDIALFSLQCLQKIDDNFIFFSEKYEISVNLYGNLHAIMRNTRIFFPWETSEYKCPCLYCGNCWCVTLLHLCSAASLCPVLLRRIIHKNKNRCMFIPPSPGACRVWQIHCQSCTCNTLTCIPMIFSVLSPISLCIALSLDSTEHHHQAHFSPISADNAGDPPRSYLSSLSVPHKEFFSGAM